MGTSALLGYYHNTDPFNRLLWLRAVSHASLTLSQSEAVHFKRGNSNEAAAAFRVGTTGYVYASLTLSDGSLISAAYIPVTLQTNPAHISIALD